MSGLGDRVGRRAPADSYLDGVEQGQVPAAAAPTAPHPGLQPVAAIAPARKKRPKKIAPEIDEALQERVRDAVYALSGPPYGMTLRAFCEQAFTHYLEYLETTVNEGNAFPEREQGQELRTGRPVAGTRR